MIPFIVLLPLITAAAIAFIAKEQVDLVRKVATLSAALSLGLCLFVLVAYNGTRGGIQFEVNIPWITALGINYHAGVDGLSAVMLLLHSLVSFAAIYASQSIQKRVKEFYIFLLMLIASIYGVFTSFDVFFIYVFYEMAVIPMYPLIGIWGSTNKEYATMKLTLFITAGAVLALVALIAIYHASGIGSFDVVALQTHLAQYPLPRNLQIWTAGLLLTGFGVITSMWPLHSWSPIGYAAAPIPVSMIHAGVLKKLGPFLILRLVLTFVPEGAVFWMPTVAMLCMVNILYAGYCAMVARDLKFIIGFSSVSHMGYVLLGLATLNQVGLSGTVLLMFSHGIMAALAFALIGFIYDQLHTRNLDELGSGLARRIPFIATLFVMTAMASSGLPGFSNFAAEILIFFGAWKQYPLQTIVAVFGILITAVYLLRTVRALFFGEETISRTTLKDATTLSQRLPLLILLAALLIFGFMPSLFLNKIASSVESISSQYQSALGAHA